MLLHAEGFGKAEKGPKKMYVKVMYGTGRGRHSRQGEQRV